MLFLLTKKKPYTIYRYSAGGYVDGEWVKDSVPEEVPITANVQPAKYKDIQQMPESDRTKQWCTMFTEFLVRNKEEGVTGYDSDRFYWQGNLYEVRRVRQWDNGILDHYQAMAARVELTPQEGAL